MRPFCKSMEKNFKAIEVPQGTDISKFLSDQLSQWKDASDTYRKLKKAATKDVVIDGVPCTVQFNPSRVLSSGADTTPDAINSRACFLCEENRPHEQMVLPFEGRKGRYYRIVLNPYPIFPQHIVAIRREHVPQSIWNNYVDLTDLAHHYPRFTFFYNGPRCGASAPDHFHFQGCPRGVLPLEKEADRMLSSVKTFDEGVPDGEEKVIVPQAVASRFEYISSVQDAHLFHYKGYARGVFMLKARTSKSLAKLFFRLLDCYGKPKGEDEPRFNLFTWYSGKGRRPKGNTHGLSPFEYRAIVILRTEHRPSCYFAEGEDRVMLSPGCADMAGYFVTVREEDYAKVDAELLRRALDDVTISEQTEKEVLWRLQRTQPTLQVGIMTASEIAFEIISDGAGPQKVSYREGKIDYNGALYDELYFEAQTPSTMFAQPTFILHDVTIGVDFHWQRKVSQTFAGALKFIVENGKVYAVNVIGVEDYLLSVISSEMKSSSTLEFLKAHSVISRSWVMSQIKSRDKGNSALPEGMASQLNSVPSLVTALECGKSTDAPEGKDPLEEGTEQYIKWFDHDDHRNFDVCADDHCQRYQGLSMAVGENVRKAIDSTWGLVLKDGDEICDCRFYKSCGGRTELFSTCWEDKDFKYLPSLPDTPDHDPSGHCFCDTDDREILSQVLNDYDLETRDFFHWKVRYSQEYLSALIRSRSGIDFGTVEDLVPLQRGPSGRIWKLKVVGTKRTMIIGKELIIRRFLSESHLKSSAFTVERTVDGDFLLDGYGWGHGVGLCQIGAAVMAYSGYDFRQILFHYYPGSRLAPIGK